LLDGVVSLTAGAVVADRPTWDGRLYRSIDDLEPTETDVTAVPYYGWGHRDPGEMRVWVRSRHSDGA